MSAVIITPLADIERMVLHEICKIGNAIFPSLAGQIRRNIASEFPSVFELSPEYKSLENGILQGEFGFKDSEAKSKLNAITKQLAKSTQVDYTPLKVRGKSITGGFTISAFQADFADILTLSEAFQTTDKGVMLPWLEWLLLFGNKVVIFDYYFQPGKFPTSRSGQGIMVFNNKAYWRVPPQFSGTVTNNWITRTVSAYLTDIEFIVERALKKVL